MIIIIMSSTWTVLCKRRKQNNKTLTCEASWYAILRGVSPSGTVRMCSFCISSIVPIVTVLSVASAKLLK